MTWQEIRKAFPHQWLLVEAIEAHTEDESRIVEQLSVIDTFRDSTAAWKAYAELHRKSPYRELYPVHTDRETLDIRERRWVGIRGF